MRARTDDLTGLLEPPDVQGLAGPQRRRRRAVRPRHGRPRRVQGGQRHARPPGRRPAAARDRGRAPGGRPRHRRRVPLRRRRVRADPAAQRRRRAARRRRADPRRGRRRRRRGHRPGTRRASSSRPRSGPPRSRSTGRPPRTSCSPRTAPASSPSAAAAGLIATASEGLALAGEFTLSEPTPVDPPSVHGGLTRGAPRRSSPRSRRLRHNRPAGRPLVNRSHRRAQLRHGLVPAFVAVLAIAVGGCLPGSVRPTPVPDADPGRRRPTPQPTPTPTPGPPTPTPAPTFRLYTVQARRHADPDRAPVPHLDPQPLVLEPGEPTRRSTPRTRTTAPTGSRSAGSCS